MRGALGASLAVALAGCGAKASDAGRKDEDDVSPAEDLMREHGVLKRVLLVYRDAATRLLNGSDVPLDALKDAATLIQTFVEGYHEKLEEEHLFPRFRAAKTLVDLVDVLSAQHEAGRRLTASVLALSAPEPLRDAERRQQLAGTLLSFVRMYEPHESREDTVLFPALRKVVSAKEYDALGDRFEKKEKELFGDEGFEKNVDAVARIEKSFGIDDLASFTPR